MHLCIYRTFFTTRTKLLLGRDLTHLGLNNMQTPIERDAHHTPLTPPPRRIQFSMCTTKLAVGVEGLSRDAETKYGCK